MKVNFGSILVMISTYLVNRGAAQVKVFVDNFNATCSKEMGCDLSFSAALGSGEVSECKFTGLGEIAPGVWAHCLNDTFKFRFGKNNDTHNYQLDFLDTIYLAFSGEILAKYLEHLGDGVFTYTGPPTFFILTEVPGVAGQDSLGADIDIV
ncbi:hypothetical protein GQ53DRAFT_823641 [Thozetella sp. PMI_491]|nr:hypothetical protein GQ53DRAFT_823641 [Thozetella sp. PMI_491]